MSDIVERLNDIWANDDHDRGCQGREYSCSCGFDNRIAKTAEDAATEITRLRQLLSEAEKREKEALTRLSELAATATDDLMEKWTSDLGATVDTKAAGVAANIINDFSGHIEAALIKLERRAALERSEG